MRLLILAFILTTELSAQSAPEATAWVLRVPAEVGGAGWGEHLGPRLLSVREMGQSEHLLEALDHALSLPDPRRGALLLARGLLCRELKYLARADADFLAARKELRDGRHIDSERGFVAELAFRHENSAALYAASGHDRAATYQRRLTAALANAPPRQWLLMGFGIAMLLAMAWYSHRRLLSPNAL